MQTNQSNSADVIAVIGATGSGKGVYIKNYALKKSDKRLLIWDYMREYGSFVDLSTEALAPVIQSMTAQQFRTAFLPSFDDKVRKQQFDLFCKAAVHAGNLRLVVEELAFVTSPSFAPAGWKMVSSVGRHKGLRVIGASQRPAQVDKAFWSNCTEIHCGFLNYEADQKVMAQVLGVTISDIQGLEPLQYIHKNVRTKKITMGRVKVP
ncbi:hypothetical protein GTP23_12090 [Pseudoduganella sp. FT93W]|uniref:Uncharacterized protein n=1 Tax=Duganella fentianensis TaxID=2692177 RepID=A0A845I136_9BURK|nr:hypothetical protein [Duganella fentianensis]MYN45787.1 hypothetical protein [Duganella fentianensis]